MADLWTSKDTLNIIVEIITGLIISFATAYIYEKRTYLGKENKLFKKYGFLKSDENKFDWQHWDIKDGKIAESPIESYMTLKYKGDKTFSFKWEDKKTGEKGSGFIFWDEVFHGKMSFFENEKNWFGYRTVYHDRIMYKGIEYHAIFINADDQNSKYVMLRPV